ncbi:hypothetical protein L7F22_064461 [Adiantum nelumboides]|nr:hypothetical protein [Adiantum nelumboides]
MDFNFDLNSCAYDSGEEGMEDINSWAHMSQVLESQPCLDEMPSVPAFPSNVCSSVFGSPPSMRSTATLRPQTTSMVHDVGGANDIQTTWTATATPFASDNDQANVKKKKRQALSKARRAKMAATEAPTVRDNWSMDDFKTLADAKLRLDNEMIAARGKQKIVSLDERWTRVAKWVKDDGVTRTPLQCRDKWENHFSKYRKIQNWEKSIPNGLSSFWHMDPQERQSHGLPKSFEKTMFEILDSRFGADVLVDPDDIIVDSSMNPDGAKEGGVDTSTHVANPSSTGNRRRGEESRVSVLKRDFQDISKNLIDSMETAAERANTQEKHAEGNFQDISKNLIDSMETAAERAKTQEKHAEGTLAVQERFVKAAKEQVQVLKIEYRKSQVSSPCTWSVAIE